MLLSLPPSLLALLVCLLESQTASADSSPSPSPTAHFGNIGGYIASGLGANNGTSSEDETAAFATTGTGFEYASSCADALKTWSRKSFDWQWDNDIVTTSTFSSSFTETFERPGSTKVTSVITLCDGHPRVVGHTSVSRGKKYTTTAAWTNTITASEANHAYPTPAPCSIQPSDCKVLSSSYEKSLSKELAAKGWASGAGPLCTVTPSSTVSYSTNHEGRDCNNCMIAASTARVMFWPVTTASGGDLCNRTASTITASPSGPPNSFVTEGITITSPTVAVSIGYMSRVDGCGTTINHTIIPVRPEEVTSVRGFRALFSHHRFNFADLDYFCMDTNTTNATIADGLGDSCYQQVPADVYFGGLNNAVVLDQAPFRNLTKDQMTIWDDYQPQLLPPQTMTEAITSLWGSDCIIHPDGIWDPPIALTPQKSLVVPTYPGGPAETDRPESTPASPINNYGPVAPEQTAGVHAPPRPTFGDNTSERQHFTALPQTTSGPSSGGDDGGDQSKEGDGSKPGHGDKPSSPPSENGGYGSNGGNGQNESEGKDGEDDGNGTQGGDDGNAPDGNGNAGAGHDGGSSPSGGDDSGSNNNDKDGGQDGNQDNGQGGNQNGGHITSINVHTTIITVGNNALTCTQDSNGAWIIPDSSTTHTASSGGSAVEFETATFTADSTGLIEHSRGNVNNDNDNQQKQTTTITAGSKIIVCSQDSNGAWSIPDASTTHVASQGGSAVQIDDTTWTADPEGLVHVQTSVLTIGSKTLTCSKNAHGVWVIPDATTTYTASHGGSAVKIDDATLTAASTGLVRAHSSSDGEESTKTSSDDSDSTQTSSASDGDASTTQSNRVQLTSTAESGSAATATDAEGTSAGARTYTQSSVVVTLLSALVGLLIY